MGQTTIILMIITILSKLFGFVRESVMAAVIGAGDIKSIYVTATTIPDIMMYTVVVGIVSAYIPVYTSIQSDHGDEKALDFTSNLINILLVYGAIIFVLILVFASPIAKLFSPKLSGENLDQAAFFTRIMALSIFSFLYSSVIRGYLNVKDSFIDPAFTGIILNIIVIASTILTGVFDNPYILIIGTLFGFIFQFIRFPFTSKKKNFTYKKILNLKDPYIKYLFAMMIPVMISSAANKIAILVDKSMASAFLGIDTVAKIFYTENLLDFIVEVITISIATITFPEIARLANGGEIEKMKVKTSDTLITTLSLVVPATFGLAALSTPIIRLIYERNAFTPADTQIIASLLISYAPYIIFISFVKIILNAFYAVGDYRLPLVIILGQQVVNVILNIILAKNFALDGIGYATSISTIIGTVAIFLAYHKRFGLVSMREKLNSLVKISISSLIMSLLSYLCYNKLYSMYPLAISLLGAIVLGGLTYLLLIYLLKVPELNKFVLYIKDKLKIKLLKG